jgi:putative two-component system response regulator
MGKIGIPGAVLDSSRRLEPEELQMLRTHVEKGARILEPVESLAAVLPIVWQHHERRDGSGYPHGLVASQIHPHAAIVAVADVFEALTAARPYREAWSAERTLDYLVERSESKFDHDAVVALTRARSSMDDSWSRPVSWRKR